MKSPSAWLLALAFSPLAILPVPQQEKSHWRETSPLTDTAHTQQPPRRGEREQAGAGGFTKAKRVASTNSTTCEAAVSPAGKKSKAALSEIDWLEMMPADELRAMEQMAGSLDHSGGQAAAIFTSERTVAKMDGVRGKLFGYVVPITTNSENRIVDLFLVPYFGACLHMPPPPPNQIVYIKPKQPLPMGEIWNAYSAEGTLRVAKTKNDMAIASYSMDLERLVELKE